MTYNTTNYYYVTSLQGDVIAILDSSGNAVTSYIYDAWGRILSVSGTLSGTVGRYNPLRYRGYVYDAETKLYYLQSRYYNQETGRFLNADGYTATGQGLLGNNMFAYCGNNPVVRVDLFGESFAVSFGFNFNIFGWGVSGSISLVTTSEDFGVQFSYYSSDDSKISQKTNQILGVDIGPSVAIQCTEAESMEALEGLAKTTGGDLTMGVDVLTKDTGEYLGWQLGEAPNNMHSYYTDTVTLVSFPAITWVEDIVNWALGD